MTDIKAVQQPYLSGVAKRRRSFLLVIESWHEEAYDKMLDAIDYFTDAYHLAYPEILVCSCRDMATDYVMARVVEILQSLPPRRK